MPQNLVLFSRTDDDAGFGSAGRRRKRGARDGQEMTEAGGYRKGRQEDVIGGGGDRRRRILRYSEQYLEAREGGMNVLTCNL